MVRKVRSRLSYGPGDEGLAHSELSDRSPVCQAEKGVLLAMVGAEGNLSDPKAWISRDPQRVELGGIELALNRFQSSRERLSYRDGFGLGKTETGADIF